MTEIALAECVEKLLAAQHALVIRWEFRRCPECNGDIFDGGSHRPGCVHGRTEAEALRVINGGGP